MVPCCSWSRCSNFAVASVIVPSRLNNYKAKLISAKKVPSIDPDEPLYAWAVLLWPQLTRDGLFNPFEVPRQIRQKLINHGEEKDRIVFATFALLEKDSQFSPTE